MTDPKKTGLPEDTGNEMSDRSGYYDESESGQRNTGLGTDGDLMRRDEAKNTLDPDGSGTTFDAGNEIPLSDGT